MLSARELFALVDVGKVHLAGGDAQFLDLRVRRPSSARSFGADDASVPSSWIVVNRTSSFSLDKRLPVAARYASKSSASTLTAGTPAQSSARRGAHSSSPLACRQ